MTRFSCDGHKTTLQFSTHKASDGFAVANSKWEGSGPKRKGAGGCLAVMYEHLLVNKTKFGLNRRRYWLTTDTAAKVLCS